MSVSVFVLHRQRQLIKQKTKKTKEAENEKKNEINFHSEENCENLYYSNFPCDLDHLDDLTVLQQFSPLTAVRQAAATSRPVLFTSHFSHPCKDLPRTRTKPPAQRRSLTSALYPQTTVHRHGPRKPHASFDRKQAPHRGKHGLLILSGGAAFLFLLWVHSPPALFGVVFPTSPHF